MHGLVLGVEEPMFGWSSRNAVFGGLNLRDVIVEWDGSLSIPFVMWLFLLSICC